MLTAERLRERLNYDPATGIFTWRVNTRRMPSGAVAGRTSNMGYIGIMIDCRRYQAHRLAWLYVHGRWPEQAIDHKNGVRNDNRIANLREASRELNSRNLRAAKRGNRSGFLGVSSHSKGGFMASITANSRQHYLGYFKTPEEAHAVYMAAKKHFHPGAIV